MAHVARKRLATGVLALVMPACFSFGVLAQPSLTPDVAAKQWLSFVDGSEYAKSWSRAGAPLRARITSKDWQNTIAPVREPLGPVMQRKFLSVTVSNTMPGLPDGKYAVMQFNSRFAGKSAIETVELDMEDSIWTVIGYSMN
jgi:hypothetical protein